ncbi:MAG TPA: hypothetical protein VFJ27_00780, partial [Terriglobia bacterium]|nr:hypothetical protein [Terriglobia bacterium]
VSSEETMSPLVEGTANAVVLEEALDPVQAASLSSTLDDEANNIEAVAAGEQSTASAESSMTSKLSEDSEGQSGQTS